jgi:RNA polymerase primary sigma factor
LYEELHRKVTIEELVAETGMSRKAVEDAIRISGDKIEALSSGREA